MAALNSWNGGVIVISHDERFITTVAREVKEILAAFIRCTDNWAGRVSQLWVCADGTVSKFKGDVQAYKVSGHHYLYGEIPF